MLCVIKVNLKIKTNRSGTDLNNAKHWPVRVSLRDEASNRGLYYNLNRYYDADSGQYLSSDPIGMLGGLRPQAYVHNPMEWMDPLGLAGHNSADARKLAKNLGPAPVGGGKHDAHHIVMSNSKDPKMLELREKMESFDIDINDKRNGT